MSQGVRSLLAPWIGGASINPGPPPPQSGYRGLLAFWAGGACITSGSPPPPVIVGAVPNVRIDLDKHLFRPGNLPTVEQQLYALRQKENELEQTAQKIAKAEQAKEVAAHNAAQAAKLAARTKLAADRRELTRLNLLEAQAQEKIRLLFVEKRELMRQMNDEEECLIVLYSLPFMH